jgi:hypothetical protein
VTVYYPTYVETNETPEDWHDWLVGVQSADHRASELETITDVCATAKCRAELRDESGTLVGHVDTSGDWRLA